MPPHVLVATSYFAHREGVRWKAEVQKAQLEAKKSPSEQRAKLAHL